MDIHTYHKIINNIKVSHVTDNKYAGKLIELNISIYNFIVLLLRNKFFVKYLQNLIIKESTINNKLFTVRMLFNKFTENNIHNTTVKFIIFPDFHIYKVTYTTSWKQFANQSNINKPHAFKSHNNKDTILVVPAFSNENYSNISKSKMGIYKLHKYIKIICRSIILILFIIFTINNF
jgi:hypothetical protein